MFGELTGGTGMDYEAGKYSQMYVESGYNTIESGY
jgi:hypothetical protein